MKVILALLALIRLYLLIRALFGSVSVSRRLAGGLGEPLASRRLTETLPAAGRLETRAGRLHATGIRRESRPVGRTSRLALNAGAGRDRSFFPRGESYNAGAHLNGDGTTWGRSGIDRVSEVFGGVSWLISWPRKKLITI